jgi:hypothetical protein
MPGPTDSADVVFADHTRLTVATRLNLALRDAERQSALVAPREARSQARPPLREAASRAALLEDRHLRSDAGPDQHVTAWE